MAEFDDIWKKIIEPSPAPEMMVDAKTGRLVPRWRPGLSYGRYPHELTVDDVRARIEAEAKPLPTHAPWSPIDVFWDYYEFNRDLPWYQKILMPAGAAKGKFWKALDRALHRVEALGKEGRSQEESGK